MPTSFRCSCSRSCGELIEEVRRLRKVLTLASEYILGVNADPPREMDDDRDELLDQIDEALLK